jgi:hypothetical protein
MLSLMRVISKRLIYALGPLRSLPGLVVTEMQEPREERIAVIPRRAKSGTG